METGTPLSLGDLVVGLASVLVVALAATVYFIGVRRTAEWKVILAALATKVLASLAYSILIARFFEGGGDSIGYHNGGMQHADLIRSDLLWHESTYLSATPFFLLGGTSTDRMYSLSGLIHFLLFDSYLASSLVFGLMGFAGQFLIYRTFVARYPDPRLRSWWRVGILFFPTLTFWSAGMLKDSVGMWGVGLALWGVHRFLERPRPASVLLMALGGYALILFRLQVLPVLFIAVVPWVMQSHGGARSRVREWSRRKLGNPVVRLGLVAVGLAAIYLAGRLESRLSLASLPAAIAYQSGLFEMIGGATTQVIVAPSWGGLIAAAPAALVVTLFRPFVWEAPGVMGLLAAGENLLLLALFVRMVARFLREPALFRRSLRAPMFLTCCIFVLLFGIGVGASTPNLGSISRYRMPLIPFFVGMLAIVEAQRLRAAASRAAQRGRPPVRVGHPPLLTVR